MRPLAAVTRLARSYARSEQDIARGERMLTEAETALIGSGADMKTINAALSGRQS